MRAEASPQNQIAGQHQHGGERDVGKPVVSAEQLKRVLEAGAQTLDAGTKDGTGCFLVQHKIHLEAWQIVAAGAMMGERSRPSGPVIAKLERENGEAEGERYGV